MTSPLPNPLLIEVDAPERSNRPSRRGGRHLRAVVAPRRPAVPVLVGTGIVLLSLFGIAVMHAFLISGQRTLDQRERAISNEAEEVELLRLQVAELEAPDRVLRVASERLGMVPAAEIGYVLPVGAAAEAEPVRVANAEPPTADAAVVGGDGELPPGVTDADGSDADRTDDSAADPTDSASGESPANEQTAPEATGTPAPVGEPAGEANRVDAEGAGE